MSTADAGRMLSNLRVGFGFDIHKFEAAAPLVLAGVRIEHDRGLVSHTDGDAVCHAVLDALFTACGLPDIGAHFPPDDPRIGGLRSLDLLSESVAELRAEHIETILNVTVTVLAEHPRLGPRRDDIQRALADALGLDIAQVGVAFGTNERFDAVGRGEALAVFANALVLIKDVGVAPARPNDAKNQEGRARAIPTRKEDSLDDDAGLPPRVQEFERAVKTKLPPLPRAERPHDGETLILYTDGASRGNPGPAASGWVLLDSQGWLVHEEGNLLGERMTNNEAEYAALAEALDWIEGELGCFFHLLLRLDSELVVKQLKGEYKIKAEHLRETAEAIKGALRKFASVQIAHVPRAENVRADALANQALDAEKKRKKEYEL